MSDAVKFVFKSLIKVPCYVAIVYIIANLVFMGIFYFKFLGLSYTVMQTAMENNYIPPKEKSSIEKSINEIENSSVLISDAYISVGDNADIDKNATRNARTQYGTEKTVGVHYKYKWIFPLMPEEYGQKANELNSLSDITGTSFRTELNSDNTSKYSDTQLDKMRDAKAIKFDFNIKYTVPCLQYYADLD